VFAFVRPGDERAAAFAKSLGATWVGGSTTPPPVPLDAAIIFAPDGALVPRALGAVATGGVVVCAGIHMSDVPSFPYSTLWGERVLRSVANLKRDDADTFFALLAGTPIETEVTRLPLAQANDALGRLRRGEVSGSLVLVP
jgi:propanol-preferring alcohol dehydrogenase